ncbi:MAG: RidA family protein [Robiginitomaculum sp.]|nr:RidA family protein [Robiginitomaculum sp.]MDQ7077823.1 RidA family protein [Robiginitomaculum sp.]
MKRILQPTSWKRPKGYANGIVAEGRTVFTAGLIGWNANEEFESDDLVDQIRQTLINTIAILAEAGAGPEHIVRMTWYITDRDDYLARLKDIGVVWKEIIGTQFPCMACVQVVSLMEERAKIEIETTAVVPAN